MFSRWWLQGGRSGKAAHTKFRSKHRPKLHIDTPCSQDCDKSARVQQGKDTEESVALMLLPASVAVPGTQEALGVFSGRPLGVNFKLQVVHMQKTTLKNCNFPLTAGQEMHRPAPDSGKKPPVHSNKSNGPFALLMACTRLNRADRFPWTSPLINTFFCAIGLSQKSGAYRCAPMGPLFLHLRQGVHVPLPLLLAIWRLTPGRCQLTPC